MATCSFCNRKAVYYRANEGKYYCERHFLASVEKRVKRVISEYKLIEEGDVIAVALSGGKDSSSLLYILHKIFKNNPKIRIFAITVHEGVKRYRSIGVKKAEELCKKLGIEHHVFYFEEEFGITITDVAKRMKENICTYCGVLRRYLLNKTSRELGATKLATGHNLNDEAETLLMNILKGDYLRLLRSGPKPMIMKHPKFVTRIKPLIKIPEEETKLYAKLRDLPILPKRCPYAKTNVLRGKAREFINSLEKESPGITFSFVENTWKLVERLKSNFKVKEKVRECKICGEPTSQDVCKACQILMQIKN
ncbi:MAG: TIGR00269 family protein [Candidatus Aenigmarchaeota archaeon]|nr:TIGR00269 family protein [Candidatus Aenigmarchaeota archaeon]